MNERIDESSPAPCAEYFVTVTLRIPHRLLGRLTKKAIASKDVELVAADWDKVREVLWKSPNDKDHGRGLSAYHARSGSQPKSAKGGDE